MHRRRRQPARELDELPLLEDLGDRRRAGGSCSAPTSTCPIDDGAHHRRPAHPRRAAHHRVAAASRARVVTACTHLGRPKGAPDPRYSVEPVRARLAELAPGVELLENLRFDPGETANDPAFVAAARSRAMDVYVNDAFGASHRAHASIVGPPQFLPSRGRAAAGQQEVEVLLPLRDRPDAARSWSCSAASKVSDKLGVIDALLEVVDRARSSAAACASRSSPRRATRSATRCSRPTRSRPAGALLDSGAPIHLPDDITALGPGRQDRRSRRPGARCASSASRSPTGGWASTSGRARRPSSPT